MTQEVITGTSFDEIIFLNRNREYGAYLLRRKNRTYLMAAFFIAFLMVSSTVITPLVYNYYKGNKPILNDPGLIGVQLDTTLIIKPPVIPDVKINMARTEIFTPRVVDTVMNEPEFISNDEMFEIAYNGEVPELITGEVTHDAVIEVVQRPFIKVEINASFNGGDLNDFNKWVAQNIKYPQLAVENGITGKVYVQFVINEKGKVIDATVLRGADPLLDEEAVRVIESSPKWSAPIQGGKPVKQLFTLPVNFKLEK